MNTPPTLKDLCERATKGPWTLLPEECHRSYIRLRGKRLGGRYKIANIHAPEYKDAPEREADESRANAQLIARCSPEVMARVYEALDHARCTIHNEIEAERLSETPILEQCHVLIRTRRKLIAAIALLDGKEESK